MKTILVADDSMFQRKLIVDALKEVGYETIQAKDGKETLEFVKNENPALITLDLLMPVMDGITVLEELKKAGSAIPVIVFSADIQESTAEHCKELGAAAFINKPFKKDNFLEIVKNVI